MTCMAQTYFRREHSTKAPFGTITLRIITAQNFTLYTQKIAHSFLGGMAEAWPGSHNQLLKQLVTVKI